MSIDFENKPAEWNNEGVEPSSDTKNAGFSPGDKPPAAWINWQFNKTYNSISELQDTVSDIDTEVKKTVPISKGGTGATTASTALTALGGVPTNRTVNSKALSSNITLNASDVGAAEASHNHSAGDITSGTLPIARGGTGATAGPEALKNLGIIDLIYPVGSIYMSVNSTNPSALFGGTWVSWGAGRVPVGVNTSDTDFSAVEKTGGEKTHTLTVSEMPSHTHSAGYAQTGIHVGEGGASWNDRANTMTAIVNTGSTGGDGAHNNLQPYITCYMWKRTA